MQAKTEILEVERASSTTFKAPPPYWTPQKEDLEIVEIQRDAEEWQRIEKHMAETIVSASIYLGLIYSFRFFLLFIYV